MSTDWARQQVFLLTRRSCSNVCGHLSMICRSTIVVLMSPYSTRRCITQQISAVFWLKPSASHVVAACWPFWTLHFMRTKKTGGRWSRRNSSRERSVSAHALTYCCRRTSSNTSRGLHWQRRRANFPGRATACAIPYGTRCARLWLGLEGTGNHPASISGPRACHDHLRQSSRHTLGQPEISSVCDGNRRGAGRSRKLANRGRQHAGHRRRNAYIGLCLCAPRHRRPRPRHRFHCNAGTATRECRSSREEYQE